MKRINIKFGIFCSTRLFLAAKFRSVSVSGGKVDVSGGKM